MHPAASIAQLGERKTEDLEAPCSIHGRSTCRGGLVGYDAALTQLRSWVRLPFLVLCDNVLRYNPTLPSLGPEFDFRPAHFLFRFTTAPLWVLDCGYDSYSMRAICVVVKSNITVVGPRVRFPVHLVFQDNS